jgi:predicted nucleotidyltransferase
MDTQDALVISRKFAHAVREAFGYKYIFLFGSCIKGTSHLESDVDIAVVFEDYTDTMQMQLELMRLRRKIDTRIEPHPFREKDFISSNPLVYEIMKFGKEIRD